jgi:hypothetical protein
MHLLIALKAFFLVLFNSALARQVNDVLRRRHEALPAPAASTHDTTTEKTSNLRETRRLSTETVLSTQPAAPRKATPARSDAITLLATLQREGRFVDFLKEELAGYSDAQIGAVARDLHRDCGKVVERMLAIQPLVPDAEGATIEVPAGFDAARYRLVGNIGGSLPLRGTVVHHGWQATACELPEWVGSEAASRVIAPAEVEIK